MNERIQDMMPPWIDGGLLVFAAVGPYDGNCWGTGDPADPITCPVKSSYPANRGIEFSGSEECGYAGHSFS
jgi:hypothetical protein